MRTGDEMLVAQLPHPLYQLHTRLHIRRPVIDSRQQVGMHVQPDQRKVGEEGFGGFFEDVKHWSNDEIRVTNDEYGWKYYLGRLSLLIIPKSRPLEGI